jgi:peptidoglycan/LPS O-acetylase OafA/YrhL
VRPVGGWAWVAWGGVLVFCMFVSVAVYHGVERPARGWLRRHDPFVRRPEPHQPA